MKLGILGTGMIVKDLLSTINKLPIESVEILGTERSKEKTVELYKEYNMKAHHFDYDDLLKSDVDTVYVALPNHLHYEFAKKALENDKHVIIEKPITSNYSELKELIKIASERNLIILEAVNLHYLPAFKELKNSILEIGKPKIVSLNYSQYSSRYDSFKNGIILPAFDYKKSGGALMDLNVYNINFIVSLFGKPKEVQYMANIENKIDTSGILLMDYDEFKAVCIGAKDCKAPVVSTIQGDKGNFRLNMPVGQLVSYELNYNTGECEEFKIENPEHRLYYEFVEFIRIINEKDFVKAKNMLEISIIVSEIMEKARKQQGVIFENDK
ncbi:Gfo/Idh/MocA family protein [Clostridium butyricum]|uniref:Gfo/Idh/MocA family protein n=1 Tax=Clostridium butyricum TaxID=1492 RepID=UPI003466BFEB